MANVKDIFPTYWDQSNWHNLGGGAMFGNADLDVLLKDAAGGEYKWDDVQKLKDARSLILQFMRSESGLAVTADQNQPGGTGEGGVKGMYDKLADNEIYETWGDHSGEDGEKRKIYFGGADLRVALAKGINKGAIEQKLREKPDWLNEGNKPIGIGGAENGIWTWLVGVEESTAHGQQIPVDVQPGAGGPKFGNVEYFNELKRLWDQTKDVSELHQYRDDVLDFLRTAPDEKVADSNRPDAAGGLYEQIIEHKRTGHVDADDPAVREGNWNENQIKITPWFGGPDAAERNDFTEADYLAARAGGHTDFDVYRHLRANPSQYTSDAAKQTYTNVRQGLINRAPMYVFEDNSAERQDNWRAVLENPIWQEVGFYISSKAGSAGIPKKYKDYDWYTHGDYDIIERYIMDNYKPEGWQDMRTEDRVASFRTDEALTSIIGSQGQGVGQAGWGAGEYWEQWGAAGPPDLSGDGDDKGDLTMIQKMVAQASLEAADPSEWKNRLEYLENRFLDELYGPDKKYEDAPDEWGLDIMRLDSEGKAFDFGDAVWKTWNTANDANPGDEWYNTLTKGDIDWAFYRDNKYYQKAREELGMDEKIDTVAEIRQANVWVHGQLAVLPGADVPDWDPYEKKPLPAPYSPKELTITGYTPDKPKGFAKVPEAPTAPTINIPDVKIKAPDNLKPKIGKIVGE